MAFLVNFLPPNLRSKVMEKKPTTMKECVKEAIAAQRAARDKSRPVGAPIKTWVLAVEEGSTPADVEEIFINLMKKHLPPKSNSRGNNNRNKSKGKNFQSGNTSASPSAPWKKCNYCRKFGHGMEECFSQKADKALCYTTKGEPCYPKGESEGGPYGSTALGYFKPATPLSTAKPQVFPHWV